MGGQRHTPTALPPGKTRYTLYRRLGGPQGLSGRVRNILPPPGFDPRTVQPVASRYTDCAIAAHWNHWSNVVILHIFNQYSDFVLSAWYVILWLSWSEILKVTKASGLVVCRCVCDVSVCVWCECVCVCWGCLVTDSDKGWRLANVTLKELDMEERVGGSPRKTNFYLMYVTYSDI